MVATRGPDAGAVSTGTEDGAVCRMSHDVRARCGGMSMVTGVRERAGRVWLGSLRERAIAHLDL